MSMRKLRSKGVIPIRMLKCNIEMRKAGQRTQPFFIISEFIETLAQELDERFK
jgi:hypothetical protein